MAQFLTLVHRAGSVVDEVDRVSQVLTHYHRIGRVALGHRKVGLHHDRSRRRPGLLPGVGSVVELTAVAEFVIVAPLAVLELICVLQELASSG